MSNATRLFLFRSAGDGSPLGGEEESLGDARVPYKMRPSCLAHNEPSAATLTWFAQSTLPQPMPMATTACLMPHASCQLPAAASDHTYASTFAMEKNGRKMANPLAVLSPLFCWYLHFHYNCVINRTETAGKFHCNRVQQLLHYFSSPIPLFPALSPLSPSLSPSTALVEFQLSLVNNKWN